MAAFLQLRVVGKLGFEVDNVTVKVQGSTDHNHQAYLHVVVSDDMNAVHVDSVNPVLFVWPQKPDARSSIIPWRALDKLDQYHVFIDIKGELTCYSESVQSDDEYNTPGEHNSALLLRIAEKMFGDLAQVQKLDRSLSELSHVIKVEKKPTSTSDIVELGTGLSMFIDKKMTKIRFVGVAFAGVRCAGLDMVDGARDDDDTYVLHVSWIDNVSNVMQAAIDHPGDIILVPYQGGNGFAEIEAVAKLGIIQAQAVPKAAGADINLMSRMVLAVLGRMRRNGGASIRKLPGELRTRDVVLEEAAEAAKELNIQL